MCAYLVDTDVIVAARKGPAAPAGVAAFFERVAPEARYIPVQVLVRMKGKGERRGDKQPAWLLIKEKDDCPVRSSKVSLRPYESFALHLK